MFRLVKSGNLSAVFFILAAKGFINRTTFCRMSSVNTARRAFSRDKFCRNSCFQAARGGGRARRIVLPPLRQTSYRRKTSYPKPSYNNAAARAGYVFSISRVSIGGGGRKKTILNYLSGIPDISSLRSNVILLFSMDWLLAYNFAE